MVEEGYVCRHDGRGDCPYLARVLLLSRGGSLELPVLIAVEDVPVAVVAVVAAVDPDPDFGHGLEAWCSLPEWQMILACKPGVVVVTC